MTPTTTPEDERTAIKSFSNRGVSTMPEDHTGEPTAPHEIAQDRVARAVRDAYMATAELYKLRLNPETARLLAKEEGDLWSIHGRVKSVLDEIRGEHAA